jgi:hypothetical protein
MKKKLHVIQEDVKTKHTAHWDWDYLTWKEIEQRLRDAGIGEDQQPVKNEKSIKKRQLVYAVWVGSGLLIVGLLVWVTYL